jgi:hypothetical protein
MFFIHRWVIQTFHVNLPVNKSKDLCADRLVGISKRNRESIAEGTIGGWASGLLWDPSFLFFTSEDVQIQTQRHSVFSLRLCVKKSVGKKKAAINPVAFEP